MERTPHRTRRKRQPAPSRSQTLYAVSLTAARALHPLNQIAAKQTRRVRSDVVSLADTARSELRPLLANLRSEQLRTGGLTARLARLPTGLRTRPDLVDLDIRLSLADDPDAAPETKEALVLISGEALHNVVKHGGADPVDIRLEDAEGLVLLTTDNGRGYNSAAEQPGYLGLQSMRERTIAIGRVLRLISAEDLGAQNLRQRESGRH